MTPNVKPTMKAVPIDRTGSPMCQPTQHHHTPPCAKCRREDVPTYSTRTVAGVWPPLCAGCHLLVLRARAGRGCE